ncbi:Calx-beta domain-containing protein [Thalassotalea fusca]
MNYRADKTRILTLWTCRVLVGVMFFIACLGNASTLAPQKRDEQTLNRFIREHMLVARQEPIDINGQFHLVNIGIFYTSDLLHEVDIESLYAHVTSQIAYANSVLENSGVLIRRQLAYFGQYPVPNQPSLKLNEFLNTVFDNDVEAIRTLSVQYGLDYMTILRPMSDPDYCGWAFYDSPYAVMQIGSSCTSLSLGAHEWGHNDGADHDIANSSSTPARTYGRGYNCAGLGTVMSTSNSWRARHAFYSSPHIQSQGENCGKHNEADVVRMLQEFQFDNERLGNRVDDREKLAFAKITNDSLIFADETDDEVVITVSLVDELGHEVSLDRTASIELYTHGNTAQPNIDYLAKSRHLKFAAGQSEQQVSINILADAVVESVETFSVALRHGDILVPTNDSVDIAIQPSDKQLSANVEFSEAELVVGTNQTFDIALRREGDLNGSILVKLSTNVGWLSLPDSMVILPSDKERVVVKAIAQTNLRASTQLSLILPEGVTSTTQTLTIHVEEQTNEERTSGGGISWCFGLLLLAFCGKRVNLCH